MMADIVFETDKKDFDLENVLEIWKKCIEVDESISLEYYIKAYKELCR